MRRWVLGGATLLGVGAACATFGSADETTPSVEGGVDGGEPSDAGDAGSPGEGGSAADASHSISCESPSTCTTPSQICCLHFSSTDTCAPVPANKTGTCGDGAPDTRVAECDHTTDCPTGYVCCAWPDPTAPTYSVLCLEQCTFPARPTCELGSSCVDGGTCSKVHGDQRYLVCQ